MKEKHRVTVKILGEEYVMKGSASPEYITKLAEYVDALMREVAERNPRLSTAGIAVLAALNLADEVFRLREQRDRLSEVSEKRWRREEPARNGTRG